MDQIYLFFWEVKKVYDFFYSKISIKNPSSSQEPSVGHEFKLGSSRVQEKPIKAFTFYNKELVRLSFCIKFLILCFSNSDKSSFCNLL